MPQDAETGRQGLENGYRRADEIGALLGATRIAKNSNEFRWAGKRVVIKTGPSAIVTRAALKRLDAVIYGEKRDDGDWVLYELDPKRFESLSVTSQSIRHNDDYRLVRRTQIRDNGRQLVAGVFR